MTEVFWKLRLLHNLAREPNNAVGKVVKLPTVPVSYRDLLYVDLRGDPPKISFRASSPKSQSLVKVAACYNGPGFRIRKRYHAGELDRREISGLVYHNLRAPEIPDGPQRPIRGLVSQSLNARITK